MQATYASRTMVWGGVIIALFVVYHLAHFTWGPSWAHPDFVPGDVYHNVVAGFSIWWISAFYIVAQLALGLHLYHGLWSMFQIARLARDGGTTPVTGAGASRRSSRWSSLSATSHSRCPFSAVWWVTL